MFRVVLIDDEDIILEGLKKVVDWEKYGCEVIATADNAGDGAQIIRREHPDILFTDIRMPNMDGLTMLAGLKSEFPGMQITVLTGYRDFSYAQKAISLGVSRFLLKPSKIAEINEALEAMTANCRRGPAPGPAGEEEAPAPLQEEAGNSGGFLVRSALRYMQAHYTEKLTLTLLAEKTYVSPWYLSKLLNKYCQKGFNDLLNGIRVRHAKELLKNPSLHIYEVAELLGFNDVTHFCKIFKKLTGMSPNEFRGADA